MAAPTTGKHGINGKAKTKTRDTEAGLSRRQLLAALRALRRGEFGVRMPDDLVGIDGQICETFNTIAADAQRLEVELEDLRRAVGREGRTRRRSPRGGHLGGWARYVGSVNALLDDILEHTDEVARVVSAVGRGDLNQRIDLDGADESLRGDFLKHGRAINSMVEQLGKFVSEVTRVAQAVGVDGKLGAQARVPGLSGAWKELADSVNLMANNLTVQVRELARVTTAVARGDLTKTVNIEVRGEILELKNTINTMVGQLGSFADEVTRVAREVGTEGILGGQAQVHGVSGVWRELTDNVNSMASNLTSQVRNIADVTTAVANGDLSLKITVETRGEILALKNTINAMVDSLSSFADEVTRMAREVGTEGVLGGQARVANVSGIWKELTENVNSMANNLTNQVRNISEVASAVANGDLSRKITVNALGEVQDLKDTINAMVDQLNAFSAEVTRVAREVGLEGRLGGQASVAGVRGVWKELTANVNLMASNLTNQVRDISQVATAIARGDLGRKISVEARGELFELKNTINIMVDQLSSFADEVTRVAREVGTEGILGGQAQVRGVSGTWRELTDNVNTMARNLTEQVRGIARVVTAVANGDLDQYLQLAARGEIATLVQTINNMIVTLSTFADQVIGVARDVGVEGRLGGQADVPGAAGVWRDLTNNVNELAGNLTRQVRAIGDVATAVTKGHLTQSIDVEARGEVALLKDNINQMIGTLAETTKVNHEQDWLKTNLARFTRMLQGQRDLLTVADKVLSELAQVVDAQLGAFYMAQRRNEELGFELFASYAWSERKHLANRYGLGESMVGQSARERKRILVHEVPSDYVRISSALGDATPRDLVIVPILFEGEVKGVIELASFQRFTPIQLAFLDQLIDGLGIVVATIEATMRTDELLRNSQRMAEELKTQQEELRATNEELEKRAGELTTQRDEVERKNREVELAKQELEEKAEQLALTSRYRSQFLANMSHELRTPLNSLLILSRQLADNKKGNLDPKEVEYASTIYEAGADLLALINEVLDLARIDSGTMAIEASDVAFDDLHEYIDRSFRQLAEEKHLRFEIRIASDVPPAIHTDDMRLRQVLRNLLSNAIKFTERGSVRVEIALRRHALFEGDDPVVGFSVIDTGIGIPRDKHQIIFEAFQQAEGGTSRRYGGTGLGLSISREIAHLLRGEISVTSEVGRGSTFTLSLPLRYKPPKRNGGGEPLEPLPEQLEAPPDEAPETLHRRSEAPKAAVTQAQRVIADDRGAIAHGDRVLMVIEDDTAFAETLLRQARSQGFRGVVATSGEEGLELARSLQPDAITLDLRLPDMDGWVLLDRLKRGSSTRHIPVHIISAVGDVHRGLEHGAMAVLQKPLDDNAIVDALHELQTRLAKRVKRLLVVEDDERQRQAIVDLVGDGDVETATAGTAEAALEQLEREHFDCIVLDLTLPGTSGLQLLRTIKDHLSWSRIPIVVYTGKELSAEEQNELRQLAETVIIKDVRSPERLFDETALFLHRAESRLPDDKRTMLRSLAHGDPVLEKKTALVVDDDVRNIFAITAVLEQHAMKVYYAENGRDALERLRSTPGIDVVLMDIMMPEMDGYEAIRRIRSNEAWAKLPVIALTAKAMKGDREKCIEAGASDYVTKPVDPDQLTSLLRVWLRR